MSETDVTQQASYAEDRVAEPTRPTKGAPTDAAPLGTPAYPAFKPKRGLFFGLLALYVIVIATLIGLSVALHRGMLGH